jgi:hypothetical protein
VLMLRLRANEQDLEALKKKLAVAPPSAPAAPLTVATIPSVAPVSKTWMVPPPPAVRPSAPVPGPAPSAPPPIIAGVELEVFELDIEEDQKPSDELDEVVILDDDEQPKPNKK